MEDLIDAEQPIAIETEDEQPEEGSEDVEHGAGDDAEFGDEQPEEGSDTTDEQPAKGSDDDFLTYQDSDGQEVRVSKDDALKAVKGAREAHADYTRKTQILAQERNEAKAKEQQHWQFMQHYEAELATFGALGMQIQQAEQSGELIDPRVLRAYQEAGAALQQRRTQFSQYQEELRAQEVARQQSEVWNHMTSVASDFNKTTLRQMFDYMGQYGFALNELDGLTDKRQVHAFYDLWKKAKAYDALQSRAKKPAPPRKPAPTVSKVATRSGSANREPSTDAEYIAFLERRDKKRRS